MFDIPGTKLEGMISIYLAGDANILVSSHRRVPPFLSSWILSLVLFRKLVESKVFAAEDKTQRESQNYKKLKSIR